MKKNQSNKLLIVLLTLCILFVCMAGTALAACNHADSVKNYTVNEDGTHSVTCSDCNDTVTEAHNYTNLVCACGQADESAVATVSKNGKPVSGHATLKEAIQAVSGATAEDNAVVTMQSDIDLGDGYQQIQSGVFTLDLNDCTISGSNIGFGVLNIGTSAELTIQDSGESGTISGDYTAVHKYGAVTITSGTISGRYGVYNYDGTVTITGGTINGSQYGVYINDGTATITSGTISSSSSNRTDYGVYIRSGAMTITGGTISGDGSGVYNDGGTATIIGGTISGEIYGVRNHSGTGTVSGGIVKGDVFGVEIRGGTVTISGGETSGSEYGVYNDGGTVTISGGENSSEYGVYNDGGTTTISGGTISGDAYGVVIRGGTTTISGGTISGDAYGVVIRGGTVTIRGGETSGGEYGVYNSDGTTTISGGTITGSREDIRVYSGSVTLTVDEDGVGPTFPGGITVSGTTLKDILGEGVAYWTVMDGKNTILITPDGAELTDKGDIIVKAGCPHENVDYEITADTHSFDCSECSTATTEAHNYINLVCACGHADESAVATVSKNGKPVSGHTDLNAAIQAVAAAAAEDNAVVTLLQNIDLGEDYQTITSGVFTLDLNGFELNCSNSRYGTLYIDSNTVGLTIQDSGENGAIINSDSYSICNWRGTVTITGGTISGYYDGVYNYAGTVTISGGTISGGNHGVYNYAGTVIISGGTISSDYDGVYNSGGTVTISGGTISGSWDDINAYSSSVTLTVGEDGTGATFPGGIKVEDTFLKDILGEGAGYWAVADGKNIMLPPDGTEITDRGDITIMAECPHESGEMAYSAKDNVICENCAECAYPLETATVTALNDAIYNGAAHEKAAIAYSEGWSGGELNVVYENNVKAGTATASITIGDATASVNFTIAPKEVSLSLSAWGKDYDGTNLLNSYEAQVEGFLFYDEGSYVNPGVLDYDDVYDEVNLDTDVAVVTLPGCTVGQYTTAAVSNIRLIGEDAVNYTIAEELDSVPVESEIFPLSIYITPMDQVVPEGQDIAQDAYTLDLPAGHTLTGVQLAVDEEYSEIYVVKDEEDNIVGLKVTDTSGVDVTNCFNFYSYETGKLIRTHEGHSFNADGFCATGKCNLYQPANSGSNEWGETVYEISNAGQLYWFAEQVNKEDDRYANGRLKKNIVIPAGAPNWVPIGGYSEWAPYTGTFDGQGHTISGLKCSASGMYAGLFGYTDYSNTIQNIGVINSSFKGTHYVGGLIGSGYSNVLNCYVANTTVEGTGSDVGSLMGYNGDTVSNCFAYADTLVGGDSGTVENSYYLSETETEDGGKTAAQFASGEVAYLLGESYGQTIGSQSYPVLGGAKVYQVLNCKGEPAYSNTAENLGHDWANGFCSVCGKELPSVLKLPAKLKSIDAEAFYGNADLDRVEVPAGTVFIGSKAFANSGLDEISLPASVTSIADDAFEGCVNLVIEAAPGSHAYDWATGKGYTVR